MTALQRAQLRQSEIRSKIAAELDKEDGERDHGELESLTQQAKNVEVELRAALVAEGENGLPEDEEVPRGEDDKLLELRERIDFGRYLEAAVDGRGVRDGAELEYNQEVGLKDDYFPLELLAEDVELRTKRDGDAMTTQASWIDRVFASTAAARLGISMRSVNPGVASYPLTTAGGGPAQRGRGEAVAESTFTFTVDEMKPTRSSVHMKYTVEDAARVPGLADAIMRDMRMSMTEGIDRKIFLGDSGANENTADITGLQTAGITEFTLKQADKVKGDKVLEAYAGLIDGLYATSIGDLRIVNSVGTTRLWLSTIQNAAAENQTLSAFLMANGVSYGTREGIDTATANGDFGGYVGLRRGQSGTAIAAVWRGAQLIRDIYSGAKKGEVELVLHYLWNFKVIRTANYRRMKYVT